MTTLTNCAICDGQHSMTREHCPYCGSRRAFLASHSFQNYEVVVVARNAADLGREVVRALRTDIAYRFITTR